MHTKFWCWNILVNREENVRITLIWLLEKYVARMGACGSGLCPVVAFDVSGAESSGHVARMVEMRYVYRISVEKLERKRPFWRC
jgi:hypothetical protein